MENLIDSINFDESTGLIPVVVQDYKTKDVLMLAYANKEALELTQSTNEMYFYSRKRGLWHKGETSGAIQDVVELYLDCDSDTILALVNPRGPACHNGTATCFTTKVESDPKENNG